MGDEAEVRALLEEILSSGRSPEEVCSTRAGLLAEVRSRWLRIRDLAADLDRVLPSPGLAWPRAPAAKTLPRIPGYEVTAEIGRGGMGVVYRARHLGLDREVAIKMLRTGDHASTRELAALVQEARSIAGLRHPHIVQVHDVGEFDGLPYFTMEFVEGGSLAERLSGAPQAAMKSAEWVSTLARAAHAAHERGIVHRDLKPGNVLVGVDGTLKITDFGLARRLVRDGDATATTNAARVGTPSYMPPEQVLGTADSLRPAADVYSLGAILYEALTGRPPFRGDSPAETERQVVDDEPVPPSKLNPKTSRDLQTICLRCLQKSPERRYRSAGELAEDLDRFRNGEPIRARPVGTFEQAMKWARRRPAHATLAASACVVLVATFGFAIWYQGVSATRHAELGVRRSEARAAVTNALGQVTAAVAAEKWDEADRSLAHARERTVDAGSGELDREIASLGDAVRVARILEQARQGRIPPLATATIDLRSVAKLYADGFREAGVPVEGDPHASAALLRASPIRAQWIAALDDWASIEFDRHAADRCESLLTLAREADPGSPWKARFRAQASWSDREALLQLAADAADASRTSDPPAAHQIGLLGLRLGEVGASDVGMELLRGVLVQRPGDFWMNWELARAYVKAGRFEEAITPARAAAAVRPENGNACALVAGVLSEAGNLDEGIPMFRRALSLAPDSTVARRNLVYILSKNGRFREAEAEFGGWTTLDHQGVNARRMVLPHLLNTHRYEEAIATIRKIRDHETDDAGVLEYLGWSLHELDRLPEAEAAFREEIRLAPGDHDAHAWLFRSLFRSGRVDEAIEEAQAAVRLGHGISSLRPPLGDLLLARGRLPEASEVFEQASRASPADVASWIGLTRTELGLRRLEKARATLDHAATLSPSSDQRVQIARLEELHDRISELDARSPESLSARSPTGDAATLRDLAEWNWRCVGDACSAARQYQAAFIADPRLLTAAGQDSRLDAASAALAAAEVLGPLGDLSPEECSRLRESALVWLSSGRDVLLARRDRGDVAERIAVSAEFRRWLADPVVATACSVRNADPVLDDDPWRPFGAELAKDAAADDPDDLLARARFSVSRGDWTRASELFAELFRLQPDQAGHEWFEHAAVQLLAHDVDGYRRSCTRVLESKTIPSRIRAYHVIRICTLAPLGDSELLRAAEIGAPELRGSTTAWGLTEMGAIDYRGGRYATAIELLERSIAADPRAGMAILNWLWLALANDAAGHPAEARLWFSKADRWLQCLDGEQPPGDGPSTIHSHNWLEAHVLHREATAALAAHGKPGGAGR